MYLDKIYWIKPDHKVRLGLDLASKPGSLNVKPDQDTQLKLDEASSLEALPEYSFYK